jgi:hypothetical protein
MQPDTCLVILKDNLGNYYVALKVGPDRHAMTPALWSLADAEQTRRSIFAASGCPIGDPL